MLNEKITLEFSSMEQALMFRAALQTLSEFIPHVDAVIRQYAHVETQSAADKGEINVSRGSG